MRTFLQDTPPVVWTALLFMLFALTQWLIEFFGAVDWVRILVGLLVMVLIPGLRILFPTVATNRQFGEVFVPRSRLSRWFY